MFSKFSVALYNQLSREIPLEVVQKGENDFAIYSNIRRAFLPRITTRGVDGRATWESAESCYDYINRLRERSMENLDHAGDT